MNNVDWFLISRIMKDLMISYYILGGVIVQQTLPFLLSIKQAYEPHDH